MADEQTTTDQTGVTRTSDGTIAQQPSSQTTTQSTQTDQSTTQQTEAKAEGGKTLLTEGKKPDQTTEQKDEQKKDAAKQGAPEKYEDYKVPDGFTLDPDTKTKIDATFKGLGLSQEAAQSLVNLYIEETTEAFQAPYKAYQELTDGWRKESENHPDLRGKLGEGKEITVRIAKALDGIGDAKLASDFREAMDTTGVGNYHAFIRVLDYFAQRVTEGTHVAGNGPSKDGQTAPGKAPPSAAAALWPNLKSAT